jgi:hypothetical protein
MKKAKIFLTALTVLAIAGGAVAFKAKSPKPFYQCQQDIRKCRMNQIVLAVNTTTLDNGDNTIPYDEFNKDCKFNQTFGTWTCTTLTTIE